MAGDDPPGTLELSILGPLEVRVGARAVEIRGGKQEGLLALLGVHAGSPVAIDRIVDELWGEAPPAAAQQSLQMHVSRLRRTLKEAGSTVRVHARGPAYVLELPADRVDARRFEALIHDARRTDRDARRALLEDALALWRGDALDGVPRGPVLASEAARLDALRLTARLDLAEHALHDGRATELVADLEALAHAHPYDERARTLLMVALARSGRTADALEEFRTARRVLVEDLGMEPGAELRAAHDRILRGEEGFAPEPSEAATSPGSLVDAVDAAGPPETPIDDAPVRGREPPVRPGGLRSPARSPPCWRPPPSPSARPSGLTPSTASSPMRSGSWTPEAGASTPTWRSTGASPVSRCHPMPCGLPTERTASSFASTGARRA